MAVCIEACIESQFSGICIFGACVLSLSRDRHEKYGFLKNASREQPDCNIFLQHAAIESVGTMLLTP